MKNKVSVFKVIQTFNNIQSNAGEPQQSCIMFFVEKMCWYLDFNVTQRAGSAFKSPSRERGQLKSVQTHWSVWCVIV